MPGHLMFSMINNRPARERGAATLSISLVLLFSLSLITLYSARVGVTEQKISANEYRAKQAFEAAQAGVEIGSAYLNNPDYRKQVIIDANNDGVIDYNQGNVNDGASGTLPNNASYLVTYNNNAWPGNLRLVELMATGWSDDRSASATILQRLQIMPLLSNPPDSGVTGRENIVLNGDIELINTETDMTAKTAGIVTLQGSAHTSTSNPGNNGIEENNPQLQGLSSDDEFFEHFFGTTKTGVMSQSIRLACAGSSCMSHDNQPADPGDFAGENIWITGNTTLESSIGSQDHPVVLIVDGDLTLAGNIIIWGLVYITNNGAALHAPGNGYLHGVLVAEHVDFLGDGHFTVEYDSSVITPPKGGNGPFSKVAGTWRDF